MFINLINPHYPGPDNAAGTCHFRMTKNNPDICQVRIDFVDTELLTPNNGNCEDQYFSVSGTIWPIGVNKICGINPDQHFYVHFNDDRLTPNSNHIDIQITTSHSGKPYKFGIWLTQINCRENSIVQAPGGCTQYYFGKDGLIKTFNFEGVQYLAGQNYKMCIRAEQGACFVGFQAEVNHFMLQVLKNSEFSMKYFAKKIIIFRSILRKTMTISEATGNPVDLHQVVETQTVPLTGF